ncbi:ribose import ATP-binding protein RbsA [Mesorhizobium sp. L-8-10]|nr:ribose import ATP-binding protein RbsA [Mesorhizobium sp. L-8-3]BCH28992.1 ribose import ATP-binding protein RbsA [Mesorhizobium sp. L-8-10]
MRGILKRFPGVVALQYVDLDVRRGEVLGLIGENGAGKSTLMKILSGAYQADAGEIVMGGERIARPTPQRMLELGISVIYQEMMLAPHLTVAENLCLGRLPTNRYGLVDWTATRRNSLETMARLGFNVDPDARLDSLSVAQRQMVEIASALSRHARLVILDEPSAVLGGAELDRLFEVIRKLAREGVGFVYISHRLQEVFRICDRVTVLRDGAVVGTHAVADVDAATLIRMMVGRQLADIYPLRDRRPGREVLSVRGLNRPRVLRGIDLDISSGEILGICGMAGSGRTELLRALVGADPAVCASWRLGDGERRPSGPREAIANGMVLLPEDRKTEGCFLPQSVAFNITISRLGALTRNGLLSEDSERDAVAALIRRLGIRTPGPAARIRDLSGGNQQKCLIARSLNADCAILLIDEPTRGVDVGAKREIYQLLADLADGHGAAIVIVSSELPEILGLCDRIVVMRDGRIAGRFDRGAATEESLLAAALGADAAQAA